jgi:20S proteasome subunit beta 7
VSLTVSLLRLPRRFLGYVDLIGTTYTSPTLATGYGAYIAQPLLRKAVEGKEDTLTREEAEKILIECMKVLYYRDARSLNKVSHQIPSALFPGGPCGAERRRC